MPKPVSNYPAQVISVSNNPYGTTLVEIYAVYGGGNSLRFRCPCCGIIHAHGAGYVGGDSDGKTPSPHCTSSSPFFLDRTTFYWKLQELYEGDDISLAGDLKEISGHICPRRRGMPGYDQLGKYIDDSAPVPKLIARYKNKKR